LGDAVSGYSRRQAMVVGVIALAALSVTGGAAHAAPSFACRQVGQRIVDGNYEYTCVRSRGKLKWKRGKRVEPPATSQKATSSDSSPAESGSSPATRAPIAAFVSSLATIPEGGPSLWTVMDRDARPVSFALYRTGTSVRAISLTCTHAGCEVAMFGARFRCGCHGASFDATTGAVLNGPASRALDAYPTFVVGTDLYIQGM
jgi:Rieske Fe-S protein